MDFFNAFLFYIIQFTGENWLETPVPIQLIDIYFYKSSIS